MSKLTDNEFIGIKRPELYSRFFGKNCEPFQCAHDSPEVNAPPSVLRFPPGDTPSSPRIWRSPPFLRGEDAFEVHEPFESYSQGFVEINRISSVDEVPRSSIFPPVPISSNFLTFDDREYWDTDTPIATEGFAQ